MITLINLWEKCMQYVETYTKIKETIAVMYRYVSMD